MLLILIDAAMDIEVPSLAIGGTGPNRGEQNHLLVAFEIGNRVAPGTSEPKQQQSGRAHQFADCGGWTRPDPRRSVRVCSISETNAALIRKMRRAAAGARRNNIVWRRPTANRRSSRK